MASKEVVNEYEALRRAKIARNEARLRELGLHKSPWKDNETKKLRPPPSNRPKAAADRSAPTAPLRRSKRTRGTVSTDVSASKEMKSQSTANAKEQDTRNGQEYRPPEEDRENSDTAASSKPRASNSNRFSKVPSSEPASVVSLSPNSARVMTLNVEKLLTDSLIGKTLAQSGKAHVMEESARLAVHGYSGAPISFNKYSGVQEWGNTVLF